MPLFNLKILQPTLRNSSVWFNAIFLIALLLIGKSDALTVIMAYFLETIIIGVIFCFKLHKMVSFNEQNPYLLVLKFLSHYLFFIAVQLVFVFAFLQFYDVNINKPYYLLENLKYVLSLKGMYVVLASIVGYNLADYVINFVLPKTYRRITLNNIISQPYSRVLVQQFTVILVCFFYFFISGIMVGAILLILLRTGLELYYNAKNEEIILKK